ncbi:GGDEF domain-containing protein [Massilia cavernae]|uniref:diguanylate cyclase n=1 Tax=Massilia cavernae TaxID=2320864 RepID=A0A418XUA2_9BURK|nr:GGDEF domain-containing protein [Massilia cavernae]RJG16292.1 GGDEF domain-containing protein [Massilia cavernae]
MDSLLRHMVDMTGHRDHTMLDISAISAVQELAGALQTRVLAINTVRGQKFVRPRAMVGAGLPPRLFDQPDSAQLDEPLSGYPELGACIAQHEDSVEAITADGRRILWLPIWMGDKVTTCLEIVHPHPYSSDTIHVIGGIVSVYRNFQNLLDYSERDSLTGLLNRKTFDDQLNKMVQVTAEHEPAPPPLPGQPERRQHVDSEKQWLAVVDVDHFKAVNDKFGHLYGDEVLILIANLLQSSFRAQDRVFRFGGEEFVVLLRSTSLVNAQKIIDRFRTNVESYEFPQVGRVTVSVGFVGISAYESPVNILGRADQALYYAKSNGRNQACHYDQLVSGGQLQAVASNATAEFF